MQYRKKKGGEKRTSNQQLDKARRTGRRSTARESSAKCWYAITTALNTYLSVVASISIRERCSGSQRGLDA